jgi:hypothetical protein
VEVVFPEWVEGCLECLECLEWVVDCPLGSLGQLPAGSAPTRRRRGLVSFESVTR